MGRYVRPPATLLLVGLLLALPLAACAPAAAVPVDAQILVDQAQAVDGGEPTAAPVTGSAAEEQLPALPPASCPVTTPSDPAFTPPGVTATYPGQFWYGTPALWADLRADGVWAGLPHDGHGYGQKLFFDREGYDAYAEPVPALTVTGRRLDAEAAPLEALPATNGLHPDVGSFMLVGGNFPTAGCWQVTAQYAEASLSYVVWIAP